MSSFASKITKQSVYKSRGTSLAVLAGAVWFVSDAVNDRARLRAELSAVQSDLAAAQATVEQAAETSRIHCAHLDRAAEDARAWVELSNTLQEMEGRDAPLSPLLAVTAERLLRAE